MITASKCLVPFALACSLALTGPANAAEQDANPEMVGWVYDVSVAPDQMQAFETGLKAYIACSRKNGSTDGFSGWEAATGKMNYVFTTPSQTWGMLDKHQDDPGNKACSKTFADEVMPHVSQMQAAIYVDKPAMSKPPADSKQTPKYVIIDEYAVRVGKFDDFKDATTKYTEAAVKSKWDQYWWTSTLAYGDGHAADVVIAQPADSWAEIGKPANPKAKAMLEGVYGKDTANALYEKFMGAVKHHTSNVYRYNKDLSYTPSE